MTLGNNIFTCKPSAGSYMHGMKSFAAKFSAGLPAEIFQLSLSF